MSRLALQYRGRWGVVERSGPDPLEISDPGTPLHFYAIDPSLRCSGWARFERYALTGCGAVVNPAPGTAADMSRLLSERLYVHGAPFAAVVERPQIYRGRLQKGDPNDLVDVALVAGSVAVWCGPCEFVEPHRWKGTIPKRKLSLYIVHRRNLDLLGVRREIYEQRLGLYPYSLRHNIADAVGLGLFALRNPTIWDMPRNGE